MIKKREKREKPKTIKTCLLCRQMSSTFRDSNVVPVVVTTHLADWQHLLSSHFTVAPNCFLDLAVFPTV